MIFRKKQKQRQTGEMRMTAQILLIGVAIIFLAKALAYGLSIACPFLDKTLAHAILQAAGMVGLSLLWLDKGWRISWRELGFSLNSHSLSRGLLNGLALGACLLLLGWLTAWLLGHSLPQQDLTNQAQAAADWVEMLKILLIGGILAPIGEETVFRAAILAPLVRITTPAVAIAWSAALFALLHFDLYRLGMLFLAGLWLGSIAYKTRSISAAIIAHSSWNIFMLGISFIIGG